jgi:hypothetical protein
VNGALGYKIYDFNKKWNDRGKSNYRDKRNLFTWYFGLTYLLTLVDAYIDAYLFGFDEAIKIAVTDLNDNKSYAVELNIKVNL